MRNENANELRVLDVRGIAVPPEIPVGGVISLEMESKAQGTVMPSPF